MAAPSVEAICATDRLAVQSALGIVVAAPGLDEDLAGGAYEFVPLGLASPAGGGTELVERERLAGLAVELPHRTR